jgi:broad specificity phosphatase PhoE
LKTYYFVRHGQTEWNAISRMQGQLNSNLTELGREQSDINARLLAKCDIEAMFASPLDRARQTAEIIQRYIDITADYDSRIMEWDCGDWSGHLYRDVQKRWPQEWAALEADRFNYRGPNCENYRDMRDRSAPFVDGLVSSPFRRIAIVSHGMIGRVMIGQLMEFSETEMLSFSQPNNVIYRVRELSYGKGKTIRKLDHYLSANGPFEGVIDRR